MLVINPILWKAAISKHAVENTCMQRHGNLQALLHIVLLFTLPRGGIVGATRNIAVLRRGLRMACMHHVHISHWRR